MALGVGVIGAGVAGTEHASVYSSSERTRLVAIADEQLAKADRLGRRYGADIAVADYGVLLAHPDVSAVSVCTPPNSHGQIVLDAITAGKHVLCEKPFTTSSAEARTIARAAALQPHLRVSCVFQHRDDPAVTRARWLLDGGHLGTVASAHFATCVRRAAEYFEDGKGTLEREGGGVLAVQGIHLLDLMLWLLGDAEACSATVANVLHEIEVEDTFAGWARMQSGCLATIDCSTAACSDTYRIEIVGTKASLTLGLRPGWARTWRLEVSASNPLATRRVKRLATRTVPGYPTGQRCTHVAQLALLRVAGVGRRPIHLGHGPHIRRFIDAVEYGQRAPVPPSEACKSVELLESFYRSSAGGAADLLAELVA